MGHHTADHFGHHESAGQGDGNQEALFILYASGVIMAVMD